MLDFNTYWYLGLGILSLILLGYVYLKKRNKHIFIHFLVMINLGYIIETVIYTFLNSYRYFPHILDHDAYFDSNLGAVASNAFALPVTATFIATLQKNWLWIIGCTGFFVGVEWLFLKLNLYEHHWWSLAFTALCLPVYFYIGKKLNQKVLQPLKGVTHFLLTYLIIGAISSNLHIIPIMFLSARTYTPGWFENVSRDTSAFASLYYLMACLYYVGMTKITWKYQWLKYAVTLVLVGTVSIILTKCGILHSLVWWDRIYYCLLPFLMLFVTEVVSKRVAKGPS
jgi:LPXTG-motif cell wall-anchored protein